MPRTFFKVYGVRDPAEEAKRLEVQPSAAGIYRSEVLKAMNDIVGLVENILAVPDEQMRLRAPTIREMFESIHEMPHYKAPQLAAPFFGSKERFVWPADIEAVAAVDWHAPEMRNPATFGSFSVSHRLLGPMEFKD